MADVVQAIRTHPDAEVAKCLKIGAVTCCIDPLNTFMENRCGYNTILKWIILPKICHCNKKISEVFGSGCRRFVILSRKPVSLKTQAHSIFLGGILEEKCPRMLQKHFIHIVKQTDDMNKNKDKNKDKNRQCLGYCLHMYV